MAGVGEPAAACCTRRISSKESVFPDIIPFSCSKYKSEG